MIDNDSNEFTEKLSEMKELIRKEVESGVMSNSTSIDNEKTVALLNCSMATEIICVHRYKQHYYTAINLGEQIIADEFLKHAHEEQQHADKLAQRISQLGGKPIYDLSQIIENSHTQFTECTSIKDMLIENLIAEKTAVFIYHELIKSIGNHDPVTRRVLEQILEVEEEHVDDLYTFLDKSKYIINKQIGSLKKKAETIAMEVVAEEENMLASNNTTEGDIATVVKELNKIDDKKVYSVGDFIPVK